MIDKMFSQEILNAHLRKRYFVTFFLYDIFPLMVQFLGAPSSVAKRLPLRQSHGGTNSPRQIPNLFS